MTVSTPNTEQAVLAEASTVLSAAAPIVAVANPAAGLALQLAPIALSALTETMQLAQAGAMTPAAFAKSWAHINALVQAAHDAWATAT